MIEVYCRDDNSTSTPTVCLDTAVANGSLDYRFLANCGLYV